MARSALLLVILFIALAIHPSKYANANHISPGLVDLSKYVSRLIAQESQEQVKTTDSEDEIPNVIEVVVETGEDTGESDVSPAPTSESSASVTTTASNLPATTTASDKSNQGKGRNNNSDNNNNSSVHGKLSPNGHSKVDKLSKCLTHCQSSGKKSSNDGPCNRGCLFRQLLDTLIKESSLKDPKDVSPLCAKACIEVYSSESLALNQCLKGCNYPRDKSMQVKQANKPKSHPKVKMDVKKGSDHKNLHETTTKQKNRQSNEGASLSRFPFMSNFVLPPIQLHYLFRSKSVVDDSKEQDTADTSRPKGTLIDSQGKQYELPPLAVSQGVLSKSAFDALHALNDPPMGNKRPLEPIDLIQRLFSKSLFLPQSTFHFIKSTITYMADEGNDSNETNQKPSPIPVDDALSQFKTTDSVYSDPSELSIMEPRVIMFGETDQEPFPEDFHSVTHVYKSPARTTLYKIWDCLKASLTMKHLRFSISLIALSFVIVCFFILTVTLYNIKGHPRSIYSRVPTSDPLLGGKSMTTSRFDHLNVTYDKKSNTSDGESGCLLDSDDESSNGSNELEPQLVILNSHCPPSYEEAQKDNSRHSRSLLVAIDVPLPGNSENGHNGHSNEKLIV